MNPFLMIKRDIYVYVMKKNIILYFLGITIFFLSFFTVFEISCCINIIMQISHWIILLTCISIITPALIFDDVMMTQLDKRHLPLAMLWTFVSIKRKSSMIGLKRDVDVNTTMHIEIHI